MNNTDLIFDEIELSGFMSFPPKIRQKLNLNTGRLTAIIGENLDVGPGERNGAGKTALLDAILYLYFGKTFRVPSNQNLINYIEPGPLLVSGSARRNGTAFRVERGENPSLLRLFEKDDSDERDWYAKDGGKFIFERTKSTKPETTKRIIELIGFDLKLSDVLLFNNPADRACYYLKTEEDQRNIIERIFGFTVFSEKAERLRELRKEENKNLASKESAFIATKQANDRVRHEIETLEEKAIAWRVQHDKTTQFLTQQASTYAAIDFQREIAVLTKTEQTARHCRDLERDLASVEQSLLQTEQHRAQWQKKHDETVTVLATTITKLRHGDPEADIAVLNSSKTLIEELAHTAGLAQRIKHQQQTCDTAIRQEQTNRARAVEKIDTLGAQILQLNDSKCPTCGQDWNENKEHLDQCVAALEAQAAEISRIDDRLTVLRQKRDTTAIEMSVQETEHTRLTKALHDLPDTTFKTIEEAAASRTRLAELSSQHEQEQAAVNPHDELLARLAAQYEAADTELQRQRATMPASQTYYALLADAQAGLARAEQITQQLADLRDAENPYRETIDNLRANTLKEVDETELREIKNRVDHMSLLITLLADRDSPIRKEVLTEWLPELNTRVNRYLEALESPQRVIFDSDMTATFTLDDGGKTLGFGNLSTGQRLRATLATNMAFRDIFELINYKINLFFVDEVLDKGLSDRGAEVSYRLLETMVADGRSVFLITHRINLLDMAADTMTVTLENGLSSIA